MLTPKWEELAGKLRHTVKVAYVDTEAGPTPQQVGQISGTPTIKAFVPRRASAKNEKTVVDYDQGREVSELMRFATGRMPNYVEAPADAAALAAFTAKAASWGLPRVLVLSSKSSGSTSTTLKALSAEYRRRVLLAELKAARHEALVKRHGVTSFPTLLCLPADGGDEALHRFENKEASFRRLETFVSKCALRKPVLKKPAAAGDGKEEL